MAPRKVRDPAKLTRDHGKQIARTIIRAVDHPFRDTKLVSEICRTCMADAFHKDVLHALPFISGFFGELVSKLRPVFRGARYGAIFQALLLTWLSLADVVTDIAVAYDVRKAASRGEEQYFHLTVFFLIFPSIMIFLVSFFVLKEGISRAAWALLGLKPVIDTFHLVSNSKQRKGAQPMIVVYLSTKILEVICEIFPQLVIQLSIILTTIDDHSPLLLYISSGVTLLSASFIMVVSFMESDQSTKYKRKYPHMFGVFQSNGKKRRLQVFCLFIFHLAYLLCSALSFSVLFVFAGAWIVAAYSISFVALFLFFKWQIGESLFFKSHYKSWGSSSMQAKGIFIHTIIALGFITFPGLFLRIQGIANPHIFKRMILLHLFVASPGCMVYAMASHEMQSNQTWIWHVYGISLFSCIAGFSSFLLATEKKYWWTFGSYFTYRKSIMGMLTNSGRCKRESPMVEEMLVEAVTTTSPSLWASPEAKALLAMYWKDWKKKQRDGDEMYAFFGDDLWHANMPVDMVPSQFDLPSNYTTAETMDGMTTLKLLQDSEQDAGDFDSERDVPFLEGVRQFEQRRSTTHRRGSIVQYVLGGVGMKDRERNRGSCASMFVHAPYSVIRDPKSLSEDHGKICADDFFNFLRVSLRANNYNAYLCEVRAWMETQFHEELLNAYPFLKQLLETLSWETRGYFRLSQWGVVFNTIGYVLVAYSDIITDGLIVRDFYASGHVFHARLCLAFIILPVLIQLFASHFVVNRGFWHQIGTLFLLRPAIDAANILRGTPKAPGQTITNSAACGYIS